MKRVTLCLPVDQAKHRVLLGLKKRGFGQGKLVGLGGKIEPGEHLAAAAVRELREEAGLLADPAHLEEAALLTFRFPTCVAWDHQMHVFILRQWQGEPVECDEVAPQWHRLDALPLERMWDDGRYWLPRVLAGERLAMTCVYGPDLETVVEALFDEYGDED
jgi:8-oxo-dGTP diphosphatase